MTNDEIQFKSNVNLKRTPASEQQPKQYRQEQPASK